MSTGFFSFSYLFVCDWWLWQSRIKEDLSLLPLSSEYLGDDSTESGKCISYCRFRVLSISNFSRVSWFCRILLSSSYEKVMKATVFQRLFTFPTVSSEKISFILTVWNARFWLCTVIFCRLDSRKFKKLDMNCRSKTWSTVHKRKVPLPTVGATVVSSKSWVGTVAQDHDRQRKNQCTSIIVCRVWKVSQSL